LEAKPNHNQANQTNQHFLNHCLPLRPWCNHRRLAKGKLLLTSGLTRNGYGLENKFCPRGSLDRRGGTDFKLRF
jgi:hypothetical protein